MDTKHDKSHRLSLLLDPRWSNGVRVLPIEDIDKARSPTGCEIVVANNLDPAKVIEVATKYKIRHLVQESPTMQKELNTAALMCSSMETFFSYPLCSILNPTAPSADEEARLRSLELNFSASNERLGVLAKIREHLGQVPCPDSLIHEVEVIVDELFTNAVFNAPVREKLGTEHPGLDRAIQYAMEKPKTGKLFLGHNEERLIVGCEDPFGSLDVNALLTRINQCFSDGLAEALRLGDGGAGIGSYMIYQNCVKYYVAVQKSRKTVVCCEFLLVPSIKKRASAPKGIHIIEL